MKYVSKQKNVGHIIDHKSMPCFYFHCMQTRGGGTGGSGGPRLEILEGDCFSTSILQGLGELHFTLIFIEIFKIHDSERCLYQNQNQVKNGH